MAADSTVVVVDNPSGTFASYSPRFTSVGRALLHLLEDRCATHHRIVLKRFPLPKDYDTVRADAAGLEY